MNHEDEVRSMLAHKLYVKTRRAVKDLTRDFPEKETQIIQTMEAICQLCREVFHFHPACHAAVLIMAQATKEMMEEYDKTKTGKVIYL